MENKLAEFIHWLIQMPMVLLIPDALKQHSEVIETAGTKLGRFDLSTTWTDSWQTFTQTPTWTNNGT